MKNLFSALAVFIYFFSGVIIVANIMDGFTYDRGTFGMALFLTGWAIDQMGERE